MGFIGLEIIGIDKVITDFKGYELQAEKAVQKAVDDTASNVASDAKQRLEGGLGAPINRSTPRTDPKTGKQAGGHGGAGISGSIYNRSVTSTEKRVGTNKHYAAYLEFGTGDMVDIPAGLESIAAQYRGQGIKKVNIRASSFLNWAAVNQRAKHIQRITDNLNAIKK